MGHTMHIIHYDWIQDDSWAQALHPTHVQIIQKPCTTTQSTSSAANLNLHIDYVVCLIN
jgi:hypothetical protein